MLKILVVDGHKVRSQQFSFFRVCLLFAAQRVTQFTGVELTMESMFLVFSARGMCTMW